MQEEKLEQIIGSGHASHPTPTKLTVKQQEKLWGRHIKPILKSCNLQFSPDFNEAEISEVDLYKIEMLVYDFNTGLPYDEINDRANTMETVLERQR